jgi:hypothetical protein
MADPMTPDPAALLPPDIEAARLQLFAAAHTRRTAHKAVLEQTLGRPLSLEAYDALIQLYAQAVQQSVDP